MKLASDTLVNSQSHSLQLGMLVTKHSVYRGVSKKGYFMKRVEIVSTKAVFDTAVPPTSAKSRRILAGGFECEQKAVNNSA